MLAIWRMRVNRIVAGCVFPGRVQPGGLEYFCPILLLRPPGIDFPVLGSMTGEKGSCMNFCLPGEIAGRGWKSSPCLEESTILLQAFNFPTATVSAAEILTGLLIIGETQVRGIPFQRSIGES